MVFGPKVYSFYCACFAALGACLFGYDLGVIAYVIESQDFLEMTGLQGTSKFVENYTGFIVSSMLLGAFVAAIPSGLAGDYLSRRVALTIGAVIFILGGILQTACQNKETMLAGRFFAGMGIGALSAIISVYQSEISHPSQRGRMLATFQMSLGIGAFLAGWIAYGCKIHQEGTALQWRLPLGFQILPAIPLLFITLLLPESPRWLMIKGREEEALVVLAKLHARGNQNDAFVLGEYAEMKESVRREAAEEKGWAEIFGDKQNFLKLARGVVLQFSVQMTGVSAIQYYSPRIFAQVGFSSDTTFLISSLNNVVGLLGEVLCILFLDKTGRRPPMIGGNALAGTCFAIAAAIAKQFVSGGGNRGQGIAFVFIIFLYNLIFSACIGPLSWVYPAEITNTAIRAKVNAMSSMSAWIANFMIGQVSPIAFNQIGWRYYLVFTVCGFTNALVFYLFYPETKGRTLEEMTYLFEHSNVIVPLNKTEKISATAREKELANIGMAEKDMDGKNGSVDHVSHV